MTTTQEISREKLLNLIKETIENTVHNIVEENAEVIQEEDANNFNEQFAQIQKYANNDKVLKQLLSNMLTKSYERGIKYGFKMAQNALQEFANDTNLND